MSKLFSKVKIGPYVLPNRIAVPPMCQYSSINGYLNDWHLAHYGGWAKHSVAWVTVEATGVTAAGRISPQCSGIYEDGHIESHARVVNFVKKHGTRIGLQIGHAGRKASTMGHKFVDLDQGGWLKDVVAPSAVPWAESTKDHYHHTPRALTQEGIKEVVKAFGSAAVRADKAGYDFLEIHGAHGYLISTFLSPLTNTRTDNYGGSFENRTRIVFEVIKEIKANWPSTKALGLRLSCTDYAKGGWGIEDTCKLAKMLTEGEHKIDFIDCSSGAVVDTTYNISPGYQVPLASAVKKAVSGTDMIVMTVGLITDPDQCEKILKDEDADVILLGRQFLKEPSFAQRASRHFGVEVKYAQQYGMVKTLDPWTKNEKY
jgi:2,4-dienoyl-CoA reductase-like NADH-dependent reductase (Old Yellow Enzyme family)